MVNTMTIGFVVILVFVLIITGFTAFDVPGKPEIAVLETNDIRSMESQKNIEGSFFIGTGSVENVDYYYILKCNDDGGIVKEKIPCSNIVIYETDETKPKIEYVKEFKMIYNKLTKTSRESTFDERYYYKVYVPKGTIIEKYNAI